MSGSPDLFPEPARGLASSVNFVTSHDGFTLRDLVSYAGKHNEANGEDSSDGEDANDSLNFGVEGDSDDPQIVQPRDLQRRALLATLLVSRGPAMLLAGDELGRTQLGNNNAYGQDNEVSWLDWMPGLRGEPLLRFVRALVAVRRAHPLLRAGVSLLIHEAPLCLLLRADGAEPVSDEMLLVALNSADESAALDLAAGPGGWRVVLDSADPEPIDPNSQPLIAGATYHMRGRSVVVLAGSAGRSP
jgi:glycogen operon protein